MHNAHLLSVASLAALPLVLSTAFGQGPASAPPPATTNPAGWKLVWSDEFDKDGPPDPAKWGYEVGYIRNNEAQYYTKERKENARVENGVVIIECRKDDFPLAKDAPKSKGKTVAHYTSASLTTKGLASWLYGRIEVKAKLPQGAGVWPAAWMLGDNIPRVGWPACGEIDIMEFVGKVTDKVYATVHFRKDGKHQSSGKALTVAKPWEDFHTYAVEWTPERMDFYYDQTKVHSVDLSVADDRGDNPFHKPQFLILNFAIGGDWGGKIDDALLPQQYLVDYVRVYQRPGPKAYK